MIRKNGFTFGPEAMANNIGKFPRTREGKKALDELKDSTA